MFRILHALFFVATAQSQMVPDCAQRIAQVEALTARYFYNDEVYIPDQCYGNACELARKIQDELGIGHQDGLRVLFIRHKNYEPSRHGTLPFCQPAWRLVPDSRFLRLNETPEWKHHVVVLYGGTVFDLDWNGVTRGVKLTPFFHAFMPRSSNYWENWVVHELSPEWYIQKFPQRPPYPIEHSVYSLPRHSFAQFVGELEAQ